MTYGIPHTTIPITHDGTIKTKAHLEMLKSRQTLEEYAKSGTSVGMIELPSNNDVLLGKGRIIQEHAGNRKLHFLVDESLLQYDKCRKRSEKTQLAGDLVQKVKSYSGRFLTQESGIWIEVSDDISRIKVSNLFRNRRKVWKKSGHGPSKTTKTDPEHRSGVQEASKRLRLS